MSSGKRKEDSDSNDTVSSNADKTASSRKKEAGKTVKDKKRLSLKSLFLLSGLLAAFYFAALAYMGTSVEDFKSLNGDAKSSDFDGKSDAAGVVIDTESDSSDSSLGLRGLGEGEAGNDLRLNDGQEEDGDIAKFGFESNGSEDGAVSEDEDGKYGYGEEGYGGYGEGRYEESDYDYDDGSGSDAMGGIAGRHRGLMDALVRSQIRINELEEDIADLQKRLREVELKGDDFHKLVLALVELERRVEKGESFKSLLAGLRLLVGKDEYLTGKLTAIAGFSAKGVKSGKELKDSFDGIIPIIIAHANKPDDEAGMKEKLLYNMSKLVLVRKVTVDDAVDSGSKDGDDSSGKAGIHEVVASVERLLASSEYKAALEMFVQIHKIEEFAERQNAAQNAAVEIARWEQDLEDAVFVRGVVDEIFAYISTF